MSANVDSLTPNRPAHPAAAAMLVAALLLGACASRPTVPLPEIDGWDTRTEVLGNRKDWEFSARIGVRANDDGFNGKLRWRQDAETFAATVSGPLGIGTVRIEGDGAAAVLTDKDGVKTELQNVETDLLYRYGWTIPVASLRYWALGIPDPAAEVATEFNDEGRLSKLTQRGWDVTISRYRPGAGQMMPSRLTASNTDTRVRIVIDNWRFFD